ncbi:MAG: hypothetical protein LBF15_04865 [Candidatus Peribacteria bacterium]|nr:hypothetical protein [Candidatus Peribacteria bacterium]
MELISQFFNFSSKVLFASSLLDFSHLLSSTISSHCSSHHFVLETSLSKEALSTLNFSKSRFSQLETKSLTSTFQGSGTGKTVATSCQLSCFLFGLSTKFKLVNDDEFQSILVISSNIGFSQNDIFLFLLYFKLPFILSYFPFKCKKRNENIRSLQ